RRLLPGREPTVAAGLPEARKAQRDVGVEGRVLLEPLVGPGRAPECEHLHRLDRLGGGAARGGGHSLTSPILLPSYSFGSRPPSGLIPSVVGRLESEIIALPRRY